MGRGWGTVTAKVASRWPPHAVASARLTRRIGTSASSFQPTRADALHCVTTRHVAHPGGMDALHLTHFGLLCVWGGVLLTEFIIESLGEDDAAQQHATRAHFWIDVLVEIPLVVGVLMTGALLLARVWPPSPLHVIKVGAALVAIGLNLYCCGVVIARYRRRGEVAAVRAYRRHVRLSALGVPFGAVAAYVGLAYFT